MSTAPAPAPGAPESVSVGAASRGRTPEVTAASRRQPSTHELSLRIQRWCDAVGCPGMRLRMIKIGLPHEPIQFECVAQICGVDFCGRSGSKRVAHHAALLEVVLQCWCCASYSLHYGVMGQR